MATKQADPILGRGSSSAFAVAGSGSPAHSDRTGESAVNRPQKDLEEPVLSLPARKKTLSRAQGFLDAYRTTACVVSAAKIAGFARSIHYERLERDPLYQKSFARAQEEVSEITLRERRSRGGKGRTAKLTAAQLSEIGRKGGKIGGKARAAALTPEQRSEMARKAVQKRWEKRKKK